jgi:hypothetical protein
MKPAGRLPENGREIVTAGASGTRTGAEPAGPGQRVETALGGQQAAVIDLAQALDSIVRAEHGDQATRPGRVALALADAEPMGLVSVEIDPYSARPAASGGAARPCRPRHRLDHCPQLVQSDHGRRAERLDPQTAQRADVGTTAEAFRQVATRLRM